MHSNDFDFLPQSKKSNIEKVVVNEKAKKGMMYKTTEYIYRNPDRHVVSRQIVTSSNKLPRKYRKKNVKEVKKRG